MPQPRSNRSLTRFALIVLAVVVLVGVVYYATHGFGGPVAVKP